MCIRDRSNVSGSHSAGSLCMVNTANPNASVQVKSDYPSVIKKIKEDDNVDSVGNDGWNDIGAAVSYTHLLKNSLSILDFHQSNSFSKNHHSFLSIE